MENNGGVTAMKSRVSGNEVENWDLSDFFPENIDQDLAPVVHEIEIPYTRKGRKLKIKLRELNASEIEEIRAAHTKSVLMRDEHGKLIYRGRTPIREVVVDENALARHMIAEAFVFPDLTNTDLQLKYGAAGHVELFDKMFPKNQISNFIAKKFNEIQGFQSLDPDSDGESAKIVQDAAKN